ncbi:ABC transporter ATP-binding protein [Propionicicella superfundia]|uniref:ABC transporter ATP-binding protein n=1 Tax=Propionicicella superfundia TaxID=348582 RepID=UPI0004285EE4|nr:ATP-binding cassette domain-containing protein [Propionicicella superfundia]
MRLDVSSLTYIYKSSRRGCRDVGFAAEDGEIVALIGPSGCGKSTVLACVAGVLTPDAGTVEVVGGGDGASTFLMLQAAPLFEGLRLWENVALGYGYPARRHRVSAVARLAEVGLEECADDRPSHLSVGQRQRGAVAVALAQPGRVLLFDEPTGNLDDDNARRVMDGLRSAAGTGRVVVMATHDRRVLAEADRVVDLAVAGAA